jgi:plasmid stabilization system protein ParE
MRHAFHPEAQAELEAAIEYYEGCKAGLGVDFAAECFACLRAIENHPAAWPVLEGELRRCLLRRFPYGIVYVAAGGRVLVVAIMHLHRQPGYWRDRT